MTPRMAVAITDAGSRSRRSSKHNHEARMAAIHAEAQAIVATGKCPRCGNALHRNSSMTGWWQCSCYPSPAMRTVGYVDMERYPKCDFQCFTA